MSRLERSRRRMDQIRGDQLQSMGVDREFQIGDQDFLEIMGEIWGHEERGFKGRLSSKLIGPMIVGFIPAMLVFVMMALKPFSPWVFFPLFAVLGIGGMVASVLWVTKRHGARLFREEMRKRGYEICVNCGYDLRGTVEAPCPECGATAPHGRPSPDPGSGSVRGH